MAATSLMFARTAGQSRRNVGVAFGRPLLPALLIGTIFTALFGGVADIPGFPLASYDDWVLPGTLFLSAVMGAGFTAAELLRDIETGFIDRVRLTPAKPASLIAGRASFEGLRAVVAGTVIFGIAMLRGLTNESGVVGAVVVLALTAGFATSWNGIFFFSAIKTRNRAAVIGLQPLFFPIMLFSTWFGPRFLMPAWFERIARFNPVTWYLDATRSILAGRPDWGFIGLTVAFIVVLA
ncbi:MAG: ABC transporter permease, partial [Mycobacteriales bacterium]